MTDRHVEADGTVICRQSAMVEILYAGGSLEGVFCDDPDDQQAWERAAALCDSSMQGPVHANGPRYHGIRWQDHWTTPEPYLSMDVERHCLDLCVDDHERDRVREEMIELGSRGMIPVLRHLVYCVDTWRAAGVFWGVGRGSSVCSLVLHKIGINRINPLDFDLKLSEWLK